jgi:hypothetical protein
MKMKKLLQNIISFLAVISLLISTDSMAQVKVQVVSQTIDRQINYSEGMSILLTGEHAEIYCTSHPENNIDIEITLVSRHEDRTIAEADLKKMKWLVEVKGNVCYIRNYVELSRNEAKPGSSLKVIYHISLPEICPLEIHNYFGKTEVSSMKNSLKIDSEFSTINLFGIAGTSIITSLFGDITATNIQGETAITTSRSNINISGSGGDLSLNATSASIDLRDLKSVKSIRIDAQKSGVLFYEVNFEQYCYNISLLEAKVVKPEIMILDFIPGEKGKSTSEYNKGKPYPLIQINLDNSTLNIEQ